MSVANIKKEFKRGLLDKLQKVARDKSQMTHAHRITINSKTFAEGMVNAINQAAVRQGFGKNVANKGSVRQHTIDVGKDWAAGKTGLAGVTAKIKKGSLIIHRESIKQEPTSAYVRKVNQKFRREVFTAWKKKAKSGVNFEAKPMGKQAPFAHKENTNVANAGLVQWIEENAADIIPINSTYTGTNIAEKVLAALGINWKQTKDPINGKMVWIVEGDLTAKKYNPEAGEKDLTAKWEKTIMKKFNEILNDKNLKLVDPHFVSSKSFGEEVAESEVLKLVKPFKRLRDSKGRFVKMTGLPKKPKKSNRSGSLTKGKKLKDNRTKSLHIAAGTTSMRREKGTGGDSTQTRAELGILRTVINKNLPAEVRRNMGKPALTERTGGFSSSVQLDGNITEARKTLMIKYTYLLSPYATFENTGKRRWPMAYNPKTLIAKSIRNLALKLTTQRLTLRRV